MYLKIYHCIDVHCHIIDKMTYAATILLKKKFSCYFNRGIDILKITALSNHKPGILNKYIIIICIFYSNLAF